MKLYYFNPNNYGGEYFTMTENKILAHQYLLQHFKNKLHSQDCADFYKEYYKDWENVNPLDSSTFPDDYELCEFDVGVVIETELS